MKEESNDNIRIVEFSSYSKPSILETIGRNWVRYGNDNNYYQYLIDRYNGSVTNSAIINGMIDMIYGKGLSARDAAKKPKEYAQMISLFNKDEVRKIITDFKLLGGAGIQCIYNKKHDAIVELFHVPTQHLRMEKADEDDVVQGYYYSTNWDRIYGKSKPVRIPAFGSSKEPLEILFIQNYRPGSIYYTPPDYQAGVSYAELEEEIASYHINNIKNGFAPSTLINFNNGQASTKEAKERIEQKVNKKFSGTAGNKILLSFNDTTEKQTTIETIQLSDASEQYQFLSTEAMTKIFVSHRVVSPILFGINTNTGFSSNADEIATASIFMENTVISPFRETILDSFDKILAFNEISLDLEFKSNQPWKASDDGNTESNVDAKDTNTETPQ